MSKNKKIVILITILVIIVLGIAGIFIYKNRKVDNIVIGENNKNQMQENGVRIDIWTHLMRECIMKLCTPI